MTEKITVMIVEDEAIVAMDLAAGLEADGYTIAGIAKDADEAYSLFTTQPVDIVLMDINIHGDKDGIETAALILAVKPVPIIYLTAYTDDETIARVKQTSPAAFLTKPYGIENVRVAIDLALHDFAKAQPASPKIEPENRQNEGKKYDKDYFLQWGDYIFIKQQFRFVKFRLSEILFATADNNHVHLHIKNQKLILRLSLAELIDRLNYEKLVRVHRSYAVNLDKIDFFDDQYAKVQHHKIPLGRNYRASFLARFDWR